MKYRIICTLILAGVMIAGCTTTTQAPPPTLPPTTVPVTTTAVATTTPQPVVYPWKIIILKIQADINF